MSLEALWFVLIAVLWVGFFFLEGFDFGVGILQFFLGKNERERGTYIYSIGPHWDGNEVWLLTAGGAIFAAFPFWYATLFSALYLPFVILLLALIVRGVCFEIRHRANFPKVRFVCDIALALGSFLPALLAGVAMANLVIGIPIENGNFTGTFFDLVTPYALFGGALGFFLFLTNGALFLTLKIEGELQERAYRFSKIAVVITVILFAIATVWLWRYSIICVLSLVLILAAMLLVLRNYLKTAFVLVALCTACSVAALFYAMFPNVLVSSISPDQNLTIWNCASSAYTLKLMSIVAAIFVPVILAYQIWSYYVFRKRISPRNANIEE
ncbi:MAG: cytochrome d ubiquinol oxidase subunit II [Candidatus Fibromonas sp.]|jgi:cytochrome d ubiquinol oxidase subunit II|nr:cytochrome d ubiquinol oxidase subunit II [Candidatus Fibromonas sp.]